MFGHRVTPLRRYLFAQEGVDCLAQALAGCHAVINLAGAPIDRRWTDAYKRELVESRIMTTRKLVEAVNRLHEPPGVMISASAVGYYGSSGGCHGELDDPEADSFLAELCVAWEKAWPVKNELPATRWAKLFSLVFCMLIGRYQSLLKERSLLWRVLLPKVRIMLCVRVKILKMFYARRWRAGKKNWLVRRNCCRR